MAFLSDSRYILFDSILYDSGYDGSTDSSKIPENWNERVVLRTWYAQVQYYMGSIKIEPQEDGSYIAHDGTTKKSPVTVRDFFPASSDSDSDFVDLTSTVSESFFDDKLISISDPWFGFYAYDLKPEFMPSVYNTYKGAKIERRVYWSPWYGRHKLSYELVLTIIDPLTKEPNTYTIWYGPDTPFSPSERLVNKRVQLEGTAKSSSSFSTRLGDPYGLYLDCDNDCNIGACSGGGSWKIDLSSCPTSMHVGSIDTVNTGKSKCTSSDDNRIDFPCMPDEDPCSYTEWESTGSNFGSISLHIVTGLEAFVQLVRSYIIESTCKALDGWEDVTYSSVVSLKRDMSLGPAYAAASMSATQHFKTTSYCDTGNQTSEHSSNRSGNMPNGIDRGQGPYLLLECVEPRLDGGYPLSYTCEVKGTGVAYQGYGVYTNFEYSGTSTISSTPLELTPDGGLGMYIPDTGSFGSYESSYTGTSKDDGAKGGGWKHGPESITKSADNSCEVTIQDVDYYGLCESGHCSDSDIPSPTVMGEPVVIRPYRDLHGSIVDYGKSLTMYSDDTTYVEVLNVCFENFTPSAEHVGNEFYTWETTDGSIRVIRYEISSSGRVSMVENRTYDDTSEVKPTCTMQVNFDTKIIRITAYYTDDNNDTIECILTENLKGASPTCGRYYRCQGNFIADTESIVPPDGKYQWHQIISNEDDRDDYAYTTRLYVDPAYAAGCEVCGHHIIWNPCDDSSSSLDCSYFRTDYDMLIPPQEGNNTIEEVTTYRSEQYIDGTMSAVWSSVIRGLQYIGYDKTNNVYSWYSDFGMVVEDIYYIENGILKSDTTIYGDYLGSDSGSVSTTGNVECYLMYYPAKGTIDINIEHYPDVNDPLFNSTTIASYSGVNTNSIGIIAPPGCTIIQEYPRGVDGLSIVPSDHREYDAYNVYHVNEKYTINSNNGSYIIYGQCCIGSNSSSSASSSSSEPVLPIVQARTRSVPIRAIGHDPEDVAINSIPKLPANYGRPVKASTKMYMVILDGVKHFFPCAYVSSVQNESIKDCAVIGNSMYIHTDEGWEELEPVYSDTAIRTNYKKNSIILTQSDNKRVWVL